MEENRQKLFPGDSTAMFSKDLLKNICLGTNHSTGNQTAATHSHLHTVLKSFAKWNKQIIGNCHCSMIYV